MAPINPAHFKPYQIVIFIILSTTFQLVFVNGLLLSSKRTCPEYTPIPVDYSFSISECRREIRPIPNHPDAYKRTAQIIQENGYDLETHYVISPDGYITTLYRVPGFSANPKRLKKPSVLLYHAFAGVSDDWIVLPPNQNMVFKLAQAGYDVWLVNVRGTDMSVDHVKLNYRKDIKYWNFSFDEMGKLDLPSIVDHVLRESGNEKIFFVGHSMGGTIFLIGTSEVPGLNDKFHAAFLLSPAAFLGHSFAPANFFLPLLDTPMEPIIYRLLMGRIDARNPTELLRLLRLRPIDVCSRRAIQCHLCDVPSFLFFDNNPRQYNYTNTPNLPKGMNTANLKSIIHFGQNIRSCQFRKFDYGRKGNLIKYGSVDPPSYPLGNITAPVHIFYGEQDSFATVPDILQLVEQLHPMTVRGVHRIDDDSFNHFDFTIGKDADKLVYEPVLDLMNSYRKKNSNLVRLKVHKR